MHLCGGQHCIFCLKKGENIFRYFAHENKETKMVGLLTLPREKNELDFRTTVLISGGQRKL